MPLDKSGSKKSIGNNIKAELAAGKPRKQAIAIALSVQRRAKMADGGKVKKGPIDWYNLSDIQKIGTTVLPLMLSSIVREKSKEKFAPLYASGGNINTPLTYKLKPGDNPSIIAKKFGLSLADLMLLNNLDDKSARKLKIGQELLLRKDIPPEKPKAAGPLVEKYVGRGAEPVPYIPNMPKVELPKSKALPIGTVGGLNDLTGIGAASSVKPDLNKFNPTTKLQDKVGALKSNKDWLAGQEFAQPKPPKKVIVPIDMPIPPKPKRPVIGEGVFEQAQSENRPEESTLSKATSSGPGRDLMAMLDMALISGGMGVPIGKALKGAGIPLGETPVALERLLNSMGWMKPGGKWKDILFDQKPSPSSDNVVGLKSNEMFPGKIEPTNNVNNKASITDNLLRLEPKGQVKRSYVPSIDDLGRIQPGFAKGGNVMGMFKSKNQSDFGKGEAPTQMPQIPQMQQYQSYRPGGSSKSQMFGNVMGGGIGSNPGMNIEGMLSGLKLLKGGGQNPMPQQVNPTTPTPTTPTVPAMNFDWGSQGQMPMPQAAPTQGGAPATPGFQFDWSQFMPGQQAPQMAASGGMIRSHSPGRADKIETKVRSKSYVIPADVVSALGDGNSDAGGKMLDGMFKGAQKGSRVGKYDSGGKVATNDNLADYLNALLWDMKKKELTSQTNWNPQKRNQNMSLHADGGSTNNVDVALSGGEYVITPEEVTAFGGGDINKGHNMLDQMVKQVRSQNIQTLSNLPGPKK